MAERLSTPLLDRPPDAVPEGPAVILDPALKGDLIANRGPLASANAGLEQQNAGIAEALPMSAEEAARAMDQIPLTGELSSRAEAAQKEQATINARDMVESAQSIELFSRISDFAKGNTNITIYTNEGFTAVGDSHNKDVLRATGIPIAEAKKQPEVVSFSTLVESDQIATEHPAIVEKGRFGKEKHIPASTTFEDNPRAGEPQLMRYTTSAGEVREEPVVRFRYHFWHSSPDAPYNRKGRPQSVGFEVDLPASLAEGLQDRIAGNREMGIDPNPASVRLLAAELFNNNNDGSAGEYQWSKEKAEGYNPDTSVRPPYEKLDLGNDTWQIMVVTGGEETTSGGYKNQGSIKKGYEVQRLPVEQTLEDAPSRGLTESENQAFHEIETHYDDHVTVESTSEIHLGENPQPQSVVAETPAESTSLLSVPFNEAPSQLPEEPSTLNANSEIAVMEQEEWIADTASRAAAIASKLDSESSVQEAPNDSQQTESDHIGNINKGRHVARMVGAELESVDNNVTGNPVETANKSQNADPKSERAFWHSRATSARHRLREFGHEKFSKTKDRAQRLGYVALSVSGFSDSVAAEIVGRTIEGDVRIQTGQKPVGNRSMLNTIDHNSNKRTTQSEDQQANEAHAKSKAVYQGKHRQTPENQSEFDQQLAAFHARTLALELQAEAHEHEALAAELRLKELEDSPIQRKAAK